MRARSVISRTLGGAFWTTLGYGIQVVLQLGILAVLARLLTPSEFGIVGAALVVIGFSQIFSQLGVGPSLVQRPLLLTEHISSAFTISVSLGLLCYAGLFVTSPLVAQFLQVSELVIILRVSGLIFIIKSFGVVPESLLQRELNFKALATIQLVSYSFGFGAVGIILANMGYGVWALVAAHIGQSVVMTSLLNFVRKPNSNIHLSIMHAKELLSYGGGITAGNIGSYFANHADDFLVARLLGIEALGLYGRAYQAVRLPVQLVGNILVKVLFPVIAEIQQDVKRVATMYRRSIYLGSLVAIPAGFVLWVIAPEIIMVLLGSEWTGAIDPFKILTLALFVRVAAHLATPIAKGLGAVYRRAWRQWVYAFLVAIAVGLGSYWGVSGVAAGITIASYIYYLIATLLVIQLTKLTKMEVIGAHIPGIMIGLFILCSSWALATYMRSLSAPDIIIIISIASMYVTIMAMLTMLVMRYARNYIPRDIEWSLEMICKYFRLLKSKMHASAYK